MPWYQRGTVALNFVLAELAIGVMGGSAGWPMVLGFLAAMAFVGVLAVRSVGALKVEVVGDQLVVPRLRRPWSCVQPLPTSTMTGLTATRVWRVFPSPFATVVRLRFEFERHPPFTMVVYDHRLAHLGTLSPSSPRGRFGSLEPWLHRLHKMLNLAPAPTNPCANRNGSAQGPDPGIGR